MVDLSRASISAICVVAEKAPDPGVLSDLLELLIRTFADAEIVVVANGAPDDTALELKALVDMLPDVTIEFLATQIDHDSATLLGMEHAVGDWVLLLTPTPKVLGTLQALFSEAAKGADMVLGLPAREWRPGRLRAPLQRSFIAFYNWLNRATVLVQRPAVSLLSRSAAMHVLHSADGEMLLRSRRIAGGFPSSVVSAADLDFVPPPLSIADSFGKAARTLLASSSAPLRFSSLCSIMGAGAALVYSVYVVLVYLLKEEVQPGWTTLSLQISFLTFVFSAMFALMSEYVLQIHAASSVRRRFFVSREIRSQRSRRAGQPNVVDSTGNFRLGAPPDGPADSLEQPKISRG